MRVCPNCGKRPAEDVLCLSCEASFPGDPALLQAMKDTFKTIKDAIPGFESVETGIKAEEPMVSTATLAPTGLQTVTGTVISVKERTSSFGDGKTYLQMLVKLDNGSKVVATVPRGAVVNANERVTFTATFERKEPQFSIGKRPKMGLTPLAGSSLADLADALAAAEATKDAQFAEPAAPAGPSVLEQLLADL